MDQYKQIFRNNKAWVEEKLAKDKDYFINLSKGQTPDILYIGCSDSRVTAEEMMGAQPGQMFVHRNVANLVPNNDNNSAAVIEYAIGYHIDRNVLIKLDTQISDNLENN